MKRRIILAAALLLAAVCAVWIVTHQMQSPYAHLHYDKYISVSKQDKPQIEKATVTDKEVREEIDRQLAEDATDSLSQGKVKDGDTVIISYSGKINGKPFALFSPSIIPPSSITNVRTNGNTAAKLELLIPRS